MLIGIEKINFYDFIGEIKYIRENIHSIGSLRLNIKFEQRAEV